MHAAWVVLLCATARAARVATPTKDDRIQANADAAATQRIFTEQCRRDRSQETWAAPERRCVQGDTQMLVKWLNWFLHAQNGTSKARC